MLKIELSVDKAKNGFVVYYYGGQETSIHTDLDSVVAGLKEYCVEAVAQWIKWDVEKSTSEKS